MSKYLENIQFIVMKPLNKLIFLEIVNMFVIGFGLNSGWTSPNIILLQSDQTPLPSGKITQDEASWIASIIAVGAFIGTISFGFVMKLFGRKWPLISLSIPMIGSWLLVLFAQNVYYLYVARIFHGFTAGAIVVMAPVFLLEIANDNIRGILGSTVILTAHFGVALAFIFGNYCSYSTPPIFMITLTVIFVISFFSFPESPMFLLKQNKISQTERSIRFYRNIREDDLDRLRLEIEKLESAIEVEVKGEYKNSFKLSDLTTRPGRKALTIGIMLIVLNQFGGCYAMMNYTASIFEEAGSTLTSNMSAMIVAIIQFIGTCMVTSFVDRAGRKVSICTIEKNDLIEVIFQLYLQFLYILSTTGAAVGLVTLGVYMMLRSWEYNVEAFKWIPLASLSTVIFFASCAILTLPFTVIGEVMPEHIKEFGVTFCMTLMSSLGFILLKCFPLMMELLGFHFSMFLFAGVCLTSAVLIIVYMPETKGKSYEDIMQSLR